MQELLHPFSTPRRVRRIQTLRAFRRPCTGCLDDWMTGGLEGKNDWKDWKYKK